jgi:CCR4-NOT transcriptional regulation complex NOT5 subunit
VSESTASFFGTKVEVKMKKSEPSSWAKLNFPKQVPDQARPQARRTLAAACLLITVII